MLNTKAILSATSAAAIMTCTTAGSSLAQSNTDDRAAMPIAGQTLPAETIRESRFRFLDLDGDQYLTLEEIDSGNPVLRSQFDSLDWDNDGRLSKSEYVLNGRPKITQN